MQGQVGHSWLYVYGFVVLGIVLSVLLPILRELLPVRKGVSAQGAVDRWSMIRPYAVVGLFSLLAAVLVLAFGGREALTWTWQSAILAGYAWDSTWQKIVKPA